MEIKTKFDIGDTVWAIHCRKAIPMKIYRIMVEEDRVVTYDATHEPVNEEDVKYAFGVKEIDLFTSREELIDSLL